MSKKQVNPLAYWSELKRRFKVYIAKNKSWHWVHFDAIPEAFDYDGLTCVIRSPFDGQYYIANVDLAEDKHRYYTHQIAKRNEVSPEDRYREKIDPSSIKGVLIQCSRS